MNYKHFKVFRKSDDSDQPMIECIQLNKLFIWVDIEDGEIDFDYCLGTEAEDVVTSWKRSLWLGVEEYDMELPIDGESFSELVFRRYEDDDVFVYCFEGFAVKVDVNGFDWLIQNDITYYDLLKSWHLDEDSISYDRAFTINIPKNELGAFALRIARLEWDAYYFDSPFPNSECCLEEALGSIEVIYENLTNPSLTMPIYVRPEVIEMLNDTIEDYTARLKAVSKDEDGSFIMKYLPMTKEQYIAHYNDYIESCNRMLQEADAIAEYSNSIFSYTDQRIEQQTHDFNM